MQSRWLLQQLKCKNQIIWQWSCVNFKDWVHQLRYNSILLMFKLITIEFTWLATFIYNDCCCIVLLIFAISRRLSIYEMFACFDEQCECVEFACFRKAIYFHLIRYFFAQSWTLSSLQISCRDLKLESKNQFEIKVRFDCLTIVWRLFDDCLTSRVDSTHIVKQRDISHIFHIYLAFCQKSLIYLLDITNSRFKKFQHFQNSFFVSFHIIFIVCYIFQFIIKRLYRFNQSHYFVALFCRNIRSY